MGLFSADEILITTDPTNESIACVPNTLSMVEQVNESRLEMNLKPLAVLGLFFNKTEHHRKGTREALDDAMRAHQKGFIRLLNTTAPLRAAQQDAVGAGVPIVRYAPSSDLARSFLAVFDELFRTESNNRNATGQTNRGGGPWVKVWRRRLKKVGEGGHKPRGAKNLTGLD